MNFNSIIDKLTKDPKKLFLIDGILASLSFIFLRFILPKFQTLIGMPTNILLNLFFFAGVVLTYSAYCFFDVKNNVSKYLLGLSIGNYIYFIISVYCLITYFSELT